FNKSSFRNSGIKNDFDFDEALKKALTLSKKQGFYQYKENEKKITIYYLYLVDSYLFSLNSFWGAENATSSLRNPWYYCS
ncbi:hypothetical protein, partial [Bacillus paranthracis]|uniref:hypothetical protein n=1 Tax=Bacillus paranthracis TaxID=2026186 RepID=UPI002165FEE8